MSKIHEALKRAAGEAVESTSGLQTGGENRATDSIEEADTDRPRLETGGADAVVEEAATGSAPLPFNRLRAYRLVSHLSVVTEHYPKSMSAEQFRTLRTRIQRLSIETPRRLLLVTSPGPGEGKTMVSTNLAMSMSQEVDSRVLLMDCDLRLPRIQGLLGLSHDEQPGLNEYLTGRVSLEKAIWRFGGTSLYVITSGSIPQNPSELLGSRRMERTLHYLASQFDHVVLDAPPLNPVADPAILIPLADGVLTVVRYGQTGRAALSKALEVIPGDKSLGLVFNAAEIRYSGYYYSYQYETEQ